MKSQLRSGDQINWNHVFYFSEIAAAGSVKAAAEKLGLSPSTLSEHLSQLELDLNIKLFQRQHRKLTLTSEGARLFQSARQMFETGKRFIDLISPAPLGCYPVKIGIVPGSGYGFTHRVICDYVRTYDNVPVHVLRYRHDELEADLLEARIDFGFTDRRSERKNIVQTIVVASELSFFVSATLQDEGLKEALTRLPMVICRSERRVPSAVEEVLDTLDLRPKHVIISEYPSLVERLCREGAAVAILGGAHFKNDPSVRVLPLPREFPSLSEKLYACWVADGENSEAVRRLKPLLA